MSMTLGCNYERRKSRPIAVFKGEIWMANLDGGIGSEQSGIRPVLVCQNDAGNFFAPTTQIAPISSSKSKKPLPTHVHINAKKSGLERDSVVFIEQVRTIDKSRLLNRITKLNKEYMEEIDSAIKISFGL